MSTNTNTIEPGTVYVSTMEGVDFGGGDFNPEAPRFVYVPEENAEQPWRGHNPNILQHLFFGSDPHYFHHEGDLADRIEEGSVRTLTDEEAEIVAAFDAEQAEARP